MIADRFCSCGREFDGSRPMADLSGRCMSCGQRRRSEEEEGRLRAAEAEASHKAELDRRERIGKTLAAIGQAAPVPDVIDALEKALEKARSGEMRSVAIFADCGATYWRKWTVEDTVLFVGMLETLKIEIGVAEND